MWKTVKAAVPHLLAGGRGGSIIITSSVGGTKAYPHVGHYIAAKHGVVGLMRTFAVELGQHSIRVNSVHPTHVDTPLLMNEHDLPAVPARPGEPGPRRSRAGLPVVPLPADPLGRARRHQQRRAVPGLRRGPLHHRHHTPRRRRQPPEIEGSMTTASDTDVYYDPYDVDINADPYPTYARLCEEAPLYYNERYDFWALSPLRRRGQGAVNWQTFSNTRSDILDIIKAGVEMPPGVIMFEDPPLHTMHRGLMSRVFTPRRMAALEDQVRAVLRPLPRSAGGFRRLRHRRRARLDDADACDRHAPRHTGADQVAVRNKTDANLRTEPGKPMEVKQETVATATCSPTTSSGARSIPLTISMTQLLNAEFEDEHGEKRTLTRKEVLTYTAVIAGAGNETTGRLIGWLAKVLAEHPDQRAQVRRGPRTDPERDRRDAALRTDRARHRPVCHQGRRVLRHHRASGQRRSCCCWRRPTETTAVSRTPTISTSTATTSSTSRSATGPLLPRREPGPARGPGRARRAPEPLPRVGHRLRHRPTRPDLDGPGLGRAAHRVALKWRSFASTARLPSSPAQAEGSVVNMRCCWPSGARASSSTTSARR